MRTAQAQSIADQIVRDFDLNELDADHGNYVPRFYDAMYNQSVGFLMDQGLDDAVDAIRSFRDALTLIHDLDEQISTWPPEHRSRLVGLIRKFIGFDVGKEWIQKPEREEGGETNEKGLSQVTADFDRRADKYLASVEKFPPNAAKVFSQKEENGREDDSVFMVELVAKSVRIASSLNKEEQRAAKILMLFQELAVEGSEFEAVTFYHLRQLTGRQQGYLNDLRGFVAQILESDILPRPYANYVESVVSGRRQVTDDPNRRSLVTVKGGPYDLPLGKTEAGEILYYQGDASIITIAPMGSGKTLCHAIPTLNRYRGPAIVLDIKGDCFSKSAEWRSANVGPVWVFNPTDPTASSRYNPLALVGEAEDEIWEDARLLADLLAPVTNAKDPAWETQGRDLLTLFIAIVTLTEPLQTRTMTRVLDYVATIGLDEMFEAVADSNSPFPAAAKRTATRFKKMHINAPKQFEGVLGGISQHLHLWEGVRIERVTASSDWRPQDFRSAPYPTLYINVPPDAITTYAPLIRVIVGQHVRKLMRKLEAFDAPILFMLDELPRLGFMAPVREALEVGRAYGIKLWMIAQYRDQLAEAYPGVGEGMIDSCAARLFMNPEFKTAERISREFGESRHLFEEQRRRILDPVEMTGSAHQNSIFVKVNGEEGLVLKKVFFED